MKLAIGPNVEAGVKEGIGVKERIGVKVANTIPLVDALAWAEPTPASSSTATTAAPPRTSERASGRIVRIRLSAVKARASLATPSLRAL